MRALADRVRRAGAEPLLTWYRPDSGARTELSCRTFANWVDKTANLLDTLGVEGTVAGPVSLEAPGHWMSLVWPVAAWQRGCAYRAGSPDASTELVVTGPSDLRASPPALTLACSLHPLGLGLRNLPDGVLDYTGEALAEPDAHWAASVETGSPAWTDEQRIVTHAATGLVTPVTGRVLVRPGSAWQMLAHAVLGPVLGAGSAVVVEGPVPEEELARIVAAERVASTVA